MQNSIVIARINGKFAGLYKTRRVKIIRTENAILIIV